MKPAAIKCELPAKDKKTLQDRAKKRGLKLSDIIREALWEYIRKEA